MSAPGIGKNKRILPGFGLSLGITGLHISFIILLPLAGLVITAAGVGFDSFIKTALSASALAAYRLTTGYALIAALVNAVFGFILAWVLVRYKFRLKGFMDMIIDIPFAIPGAVGGIALTAIFSRKGLIGSLFDPFGIQIAYTHLGVLVSFIFVGIPFVVRAVQPVLEELEHSYEEAAHSLGADSWQTFIRVILPPVLPALISGSALAFARALGEFGTVVFVSGNLPFESEVITQIIYNKIDQYDIQGASVIAFIVLAASFLIMLGVNLVQQKLFRGGRKS